MSCTVRCAPQRGIEFMEAVRGGRFLFALVLSHTETSSIPGITAAGASPELVRLTPAADAEFIHYGECMSGSVPATPDGKPTPALLTKVALESASIPHVAVDAGCAAPPRLPHVWTGLGPGRNIRDGPAMSESDAARALGAGRTVGRMLAPLADCLVIGESVPGGTTTALAVLRGLGHGSARVSSSMPDNPVALKESVARAAASRAGSADPVRVAAAMGDPMMLFVAGMLGSASAVSRVMLAGGTQMAAVLALAGRLGYDESRTALASTEYVIADPSANLVKTVWSMSGVPVIGADPGLAHSQVPGLRALSEGFAKEGAGAGGCVAAAHLRAGIRPGRMLEMAEAEYRRAFT